jgi:hypothetical protein
MAPPPWRSIGPAKKPNGKRQRGSKRSAWLGTLSRRLRATSHQLKQSRRLGFDVPANVRPKSEINLKNRQGKTLKGDARAERPSDDSASAFRGTGSPAGKRSSNFSTGLFPSCQNGGVTRRTLLRLFVGHLYPLIGKFEQTFSLVGAFSASAAAGSPA